MVWLCFGVCLKSPFSHPSLSPSLSSARHRPLSSLFSGVVSSFLTIPIFSFIPAADTAPLVKYGLRSTLSPMTCKYSGRRGAAGCAGFRTRLAPLYPSKPTQKRRRRSHAPPARRAIDAPATSMNIATLCGATDAVLTRRAAQLRNGRRVRRTVSRIAPVWLRGGGQMRGV